jgi:peptidoglycan/xylan/chitin deacetylase (PgdA/CDA1 family)
MGPAECEEFVEELKRMEPVAREAALSQLHIPSKEDLSLAEPLNATLDWNELATLRDSGVLFGSHTYSHQILTQLKSGEVFSELIESKQDIEARLGAECETFAYPNGNWSPEVREAVARAGYRIAFTTQLGLWTRFSDPLCVPRMNISEGHLVGLRGRFSRAMFEYNVFWRTIMALFLSVTFSTPIPEVGLL